MHIRKWHTAILFCFAAFVTASSGVSAALMQEEEGAASSSADVTATSESDTVVKPIVRLVPETNFPRTKSRALLQMEPAVPQTPVKRVSAPVKVKNLPDPVWTIQDQERATQDALSDWPRKSIREISLDIRETSEKRPEDNSEQLIASSHAAWKEFEATSKVFAWAAPNIKYQPLYFEDVALERYGQSYCGLRQWARSALHFTNSAILLPYHARFDPPQSCDYPLGFCRPGNCTPSVRQKQWYGWYGSYR